MRLDYSDLENYKTVFGTIDYRKDGNGDTFNEYFTTEQEARDSAFSQWEKLTDKEKAQRVIDVAELAVEDGEPAADYTPLETYEK